MSASSDEKTAGFREAERARLTRLPDFPAERPRDETGVLLSDRIKHYCLKYKLIDPFDDELLKPAGYDLTVGANYSVLGERRALNEGKTLEIEPYQVAIIETCETINMPKFLVARWNVRVTRAYEGLLWVGGAQVDPGFRGHLCCPIYNLSTKKVTLAFGDTLAMIYFVTTTPYEKGICKEFPWRDRKMLLFSDYPSLSSGIEAQVKEFEKDIEDGKNATRTELVEAKTSTETSFRSVEMRIDSFVARIFTVVAVLFTALGIIATRASDQLGFLSPPVWAAAVALWFASLPYIKRSRGERPQPSAWYERVTPAILVMVGTIIAVGVLLSAFSAHVSAVEVKRAGELAARTATAVEKERQSGEAAIQQLRQQLEAKIDALQQQHNQLPQRQAGIR